MMTSGRDVEVPTGYTHLQVTIGGLESKQAGHCTAQYLLESELLLVRGLQTVHI